MAEIPSQPPEGEPKEVDIEGVKEYFFSMQDPEDDPDLTTIINNGSHGNFFDEITTKKGEEISAYKIAVNDAAEYKRAKEEYEKEGRQDKVNQYKEAGERAEKVVAFLEKLALERAENSTNFPGDKLSESDAGKIIGAIQNDPVEKPEVSADPAQQEQEAKAKKELDELYNSQSIDVGAEKAPSFSNTETTGQLSERPLAGPAEPLVSGLAEDQRARLEVGAPQATIEPLAPAESEPEKKKEREYDKLGRQLEEFKTLWVEKKEKEIIALAREMSGKKIKNAEEAKEIYKKKLGLYKTATKIIESSRIRKQLKEIADATREAGGYKKGKKTVKIGKEDKINGRLFFKNGKYYFEFAGKLFLVEKKLVDKKGKPPVKADAINVESPELPPELPQEPPALPEQPSQETPPPLTEAEQNQVEPSVETPAVEAKDLGPEIETGEEVHDIHADKFVIHTGGQGPEVRHDQEKEKKEKKYEATLALINEEIETLKKILEEQSNPDLGNILFDPKELKNDIKKQNDILKSAEAGDFDPLIKFVAEKVSGRNKILPTFFSLERPSVIDLDAKYLDMINEIVGENSTLLTAEQKNTFLSFLAQIKDRGNPSQNLLTGGLIAILNPELPPAPIKLKPFLKFKETVLAQKEKKRSLWDKIFGRK